MKSLKAQSARHRALVQQNRDWRYEFQIRTKYCMVCGCERGTRKANGHIVNEVHVDEMLPGKNRQRSYSRRECCLVSCDFCNIHVTPGMPLAERLVYKLRGDPLWFDLDVIREVYGGGVLVTMADIRKAAGLWAT